MPPVPAVIPASGLSLRMERPKPLLDAGGQTFLGKILSALRTGGAGPLFVVVRDPKGAIGREAAAHGARVLHNPAPERGPITSLQVGIRHLPEEAPGVLFAPADHPLFQPSTVRHLLEAFHRSRHLVVVPTYAGRRGHPVIFSRELFPELLEGGLPEGPRTVIRRHLAARLEVGVEDPGVLADIDTPEEYRKHFP